MGKAQTKGASKNERRTSDVLICDGDFGDGGFGDGGFGGGGFGDGGIDASFRVDFTTGSWRAGHDWTTSLAMTINRLLIANRGEIAIRIARTATEVAIRTAGTFSEDDAHCLHVRRMTAVRWPPGAGTTAWLGIDAIVAQTREAGCGAVHPGYGFLSENPLFASVEAAGLIFVRPETGTLSLFGDKTAARDAGGRDAEFRRREDEPYANGKAIAVASIMEIDTVIDPADTRRWIMRGLKTHKPRPAEGRRRPFVDTW